MISTTSVDDPLAVELWQLAGYMPGRLEELPRDPFRLAAAADVVVKCVSKRVKGGEITYPSQRFVVVSKTRTDILRENVGEGIAHARIPVHVLHIHVHRKDRAMTESEDPGVEQAENGDETETVEDDGSAGETLVDPADPATESTEAGEE